MELRHLRYFIAVAEDENVTRAAARLHLSQPPLTRQIHDLETELGVELFERTAKSIRLTDAGRVFLKEARAALCRVDEAVQAVRAIGAGHRGALHVGYAPTPTAALLPALLRELKKRTPAVRVTLHDLTSPEMLAGLRASRVDAALMMQPSPAAAAGLIFEKLRTYPIAVAVASEHPFAQRRSVALKAVLTEPLVAYSRAEYPDYYKFLARVVGPTTKHLRIVEECDSGMSLIAAIESGKGVAIIAAIVAETAGRRLRFVPITPAPAPAVVGIAYRKESVRGLTGALIAAARSLAD